MTVGDLDAELRHVSARLREAEQLVVKAAEAERNATLLDQPLVLAARHDRASAQLADARAAVTAVEDTKSGGEQSPSSEQPARRAPAADHPTTSETAAQSSDMGGLARALSMSTGEPRPASPACDDCSEDGRGDLAAGALVEVVAGEHAGRRGRVTGARDQVMVLFGKLGTRRLPYRNLKVVDDVDGPKADDQSPEAVLLRSWLTQVQEPAVKQAESAQEMTAAFGDFAYPLDEGLLKRLHGRLALFLCANRQFRSRPGMLERLQKGMKRAYSLKSGEGTGMMQEALATRVAEVAGARFIAIDAAVLDAVRAAASRHSMPAGEALATILGRLCPADGTRGAVVWLRGFDSMLRSKSVCAALQAALSENGRPLVVLGGGTGDSRPLHFHYDTIPAGGSAGGLSRIPASTPVTDDGATGSSGVSSSPSIPFPTGGAGYGDGHDEYSEDFMQNSHTRGLGAPLDREMAFSPATAKALADHAVGLPQLRAELRRVAQLGDDRLASGTWPRYAGATLTEERLVAKNRLLSLQADGLPPVADGAQRLWRGERDTAKLCSGTTESGAELVRALLAEMQSGMEVQLRGPTCLDQPTLDGCQKVVDEETAPAERVLLTAARKCAASAKWPPAGVEIPDRHTAIFLLRQEAVLRRISQLAIPGWAEHHSWEGFGGLDVDAERALARTHMTHLGRLGWRIGRAVETIWLKERSGKELVAATIAEGLDAGSAAVVRVILACVGAEREAAARAMPKREQKKDGDAKAKAEDEDDGKRFGIWEVHTQKGWRPFSFRDNALLERSWRWVKSLDRVRIASSPDRHTFNFQTMKLTNCRTKRTQSIRRRLPGDRIPEADDEDDEAATSPRSTPLDRHEVLKLVETWEIQPPSDPKKLQLWSKLLRRDMEAVRRMDNASMLRSTLASKRVSCPGIDRAETGIIQLLTQRALTPGEGEAVVNEALLHAVGASVLNPGRKGEPELTPESLHAAFAAKCNLSASGGRKPKSKQELEKLVGDNKHEKSLLAGLLSPEDVGVKWDEVGGLDSTKELLREASVYPLKYPELYNVGVSASPPGVLLYGPPGTGKTLLAKAVATETGASFMYIDTAMISSQWHGESEKHARAVFTLARKVAPCIIFIDEIDALAAARDSSEHSTVVGVKTTLLREWDGLAGDNEGVMVVGATNRPFALDEAVLSRMPRRVGVNPPTTAELGKILEILLKGVPKDAQLNLTRFAELELKGYSGRDVKEVVRVAVLTASHNAARELERSEKQSHISVADFQRTRRPITVDDLKSARKKVAPAGGTDGGSILEGIRKWEREMGGDDRHRREVEKILYM
eukprot:TRINITY_DN39366_c0_g1_i1.p1 TRINITY_DN39366_c0_g1~~TRINITY_DN39366_c0_g1_i1.p1  ORF type:complete len:1356 (+),score=523.48 TRINITY_DN39366_c0_g1_i1:114-4070(+)